MLTDGPPSGCRAGRRLLRARSAAKMLSMSSNTRRALSACAFALILLAGLRRDLFVIVFSDRRPLQREIASSVDQSAPGYPDFLREVWRRTRPGETILLLFRPAQGQPTRWIPYYRPRTFPPVPYV